MKKTVRIKSIPIDHTDDEYKIYPTYIAVDFFRKICEASSGSVTLEVVKCKQETGKIRLYGEELDIMTAITTMVSLQGKYFEIY